jgi:tetratricopeptide (TPR) repeat protein
LLRYTNRLAEAEPLYRRALTIVEKNHSPDHPFVAICLNNLGGLLRYTDRLAEAEPLYRRALAIDEANYGPDHPTVAIRLNNLAALLRITNRPSEAERLFRRVLAIDEASYGPDHPEVATDLNNLAVLLRDTTGLAEAEPFYRRAALILLRSSKTSGHLLPNTAPALRNYAFALGKTGREPDDASAVLASVMIEAGFDPAELWPQVFGDDG